jgi:cation diffusion facilitator family transporter
MSEWIHGHTFLGESHGEHERRTWSVVALTAVMMVTEIAGGLMFGSIALVADGWHMGTHVAALAIAGFAYLFARRHVHDTRFSLGTGKFGELAAFASAIILAIIALGIGYESLLRLFNPVVIHFREALPIAALGLCVNLASAWLLRDTHDHAHGHGHTHDRSARHDHAHDGHTDDGHAHQDHAHDHHTHGDHAHDHAGQAASGRSQDSNYRAAYVHVLADALTSSLTIVALGLAWAFGWTFMDPLVGLIGTIVILSWSVSLVRSAGGILLDAVPDPELARRIRERIETDGDQLADLHLWQLGPGHAAVIASVVSDSPRTPSAYKERLGDLTGLSHVTIEVNQCQH